MDICINNCDIDPDGPKVSVGDVLTWHNKGDENRTVVFDQSTPDLFGTGKHPCIPVPKHGKSDDMKVRDGVDIRGKTWKYGLEQCHRQDGPHSIVINQ